MEHSRFDPEQQVRGIRAAVDSVKSEVRGLPREEAKARLLAALRQHEAFLPMAEVDSLARQLSDPWSPLRHPVRAIRQIRREAREPDPESVRSQAEADDLGTRLEDLHSAEGLETLSISSTRTFDGMVHVVTIHPWSETTAARIRHRAAPIPVTVKGRDD